MGDQLFSSNPLNAQPAVVSVINLKGGTGKTTSAIYMATALADKNCPVIIIDADSEQSALNWSLDSGFDFEVVPAEKDRLGRQAKAYAAEGKTVIIDCAPNNRDSLFSAALASDVIVVPVAPTGQDVNRLGPTLELLLQVEESRKADLVYILVTKWDRRRTLAKEFIEVFRAYPLLNSKVSNRVIYQKEFGRVPNYLREYENVIEEVMSHVA